MTYIFSAIGVFLLAQLFDYLSMTSYSQFLGYTYKYFPLNLRRQICLVFISVCFVFSMYFADATSPPIWIVVVASIPIVLYIYFMISDLYACKPRDEAKRVDD